MYFRRLAEEVQESHPAAVRNINRVLHDELHPDLRNLQEPFVKMNVKGRPKGSKSTKRVRSSWERGAKKETGQGPGRGRGRSSGRSSGSDGKRVSSSSVNPNSATGTSFNFSESSFIFGCFFFVIVYSHFFFT